MASPSRNIEIKAKVKSLDNLIKKAKELSHSAGEFLIQEDTFFNVPHGRLKLRKEVKIVTSKIKRFNLMNRLYFLTLYKV